MEAQAREHTETTARLLHVLTDLSYLGARVFVEKGETWPLEQDFARAIRESPSTTNRTVLEAFGTGLRQESHVLRAQPGDCYGQLYSRLWRNDGGLVDRRLTATKQQLAKPWLRARIPLPSSDPALARLLSGHRGVVRAVAVSGDGQLVVSGGDDGTIRLWDGASGQA
jgi:WD40 repeat protein